ncbi:MAG: hypothetical protein ACSLFQ_14310, partial [Thermoanaerobaculia bacterium]
SGYDSCEITNSPAATLLLPYFEVDPSGAGENTVVAITNTSDTAIVVHTTVWTNWSFPVLDFNLYLTGYDVVTMSLRDLLVSGNIPNTGHVTSISPVGVRSRTDASTAASPVRLIAPYNAAGLASTCASAQGGNGAVPGFLLAQIQSGLTGGPYSAGGTPCGQVGDIHDNMVGYITFDTSAVCSQSLPTDAVYYATEIRWENQLTGDYIRLNDAEGVSGGNPLVHIAAIPGGDSTPVTTLPWTFYNRYQSGIGVLDRRVPLPFLFAGRYIEAGEAFDTDFVIWREGVTDQVGTLLCNTILPDNASFPYVELVRFDERENPTTRTGGCQVSPCPPNQGLSETQLININNTSIFPSDPSADNGGWVYFNLTIPEGDPLGWGRPSQNWVQIRMTGAARYGVDFDAAYLGNGCLGFVGVTYLTGGNGVNIPGEKIGPKYEGGSIGWIGN